MGIILNEVVEAERILNSGDVDKHPMASMTLLARYFRQREGLGKMKAYYKLNDFMKVNYKGYNPAVWEDLIENACKKGTNRPLIEIEYIGITQKELDSIQSVENAKYQRLLFTMLCYAKFYNTVNEKNNSWVNVEIKEIYNSARVTVRYKVDKLLYMNELYKSGFIELSPKNDNMNMRLTYVDMDGESVIKISDYRELGYEYLNYINEGKFTRCEVCGRLVRIKNKYAPQKYCIECAKLTESQNAVLRKRKQRENENVTKTFAPQIQ